MTKFTPKIIFTLVLSLVFLTGVIGTFFAFQFAQSNSLDNRSDASEGAIPLQSESTQLIISSSKSSVSAGDSFTIDISIDPTADKDFVITGADIIIPLPSTGVARATSITSTGAFDNVTKAEIDTQSNQIVYSANNSTITDRDGLPRGVTTKTTLATVTFQLPDNFAAQANGLEPTQVSLQALFESNNSTTDSNIIGFSKKTFVEEQSPQERLLQKPRVLTLSIVDKKTCVKAGCSSQLCVDSSSAAANAFTTCEYKSEYACYQSASCEVQADGNCGWTQTESLQTCVYNATNNVQNDELSNAGSDTRYTGTISWTNCINTVGHVILESYPEQCQMPDGQRVTKPGAGLIIDEVIMTYDECSQVSGSRILESNPPQCQLPSGQRITQTTSSGLVIDSIEDPELLKADLESDPDVSNFKLILGRTHKNTTGTLYGYETRVSTQPIAELGNTSITQLPNAGGSTKVYYTLGEFETDSQGEAAIQLPEEVLGKTLTLVTKTDKHLANSKNTTVRMPNSLQEERLVQVEFTDLIPGDIYRPEGLNYGDNVINTFDALELIRRIGRRKTFGSLDTDLGDLNNDGVVNTRDLAILVRNFGRKGEEIDSSVLNKSNSNSNADRSDAYRSSGDTTTENGCKVSGGNWIIDGNGIGFCTTPLSDGGKSCTSSSQCQEQCITHNNVLPGQCQSQTPLLGCNQIVEGNKVVATICE